MPYHTRSKRGHLHGKHELEKAEEEKRGRADNDYLQRAMDKLGMKGRIDPERLDEVLELAAKYKARAMGGRRTRRGRKTRSTRRR